MPSLSIEQMKNLWEFFSRVEKIEILNDNFRRIYADVDDLVTIEPIHRLFRGIFNTQSHLEFGLCFKKTRKNKSNKGFYTLTLNEKKLEQNGLLFEGSPFKIVFGGGSDKSVLATLERKVLEFQGFLEGGT